MTEMEIPLLELLQKNTRWRWDEKKEAAFNNITKTFTENIKINLPDYNETYTLRIDASLHRFAGVLLQTQNGIEVPIYLVSSGFSSTFCVNKFRLYLIRNHFKIETDNLAPTTILNNKYGNSRIHRWALSLQEYSFDINHLPGKKNIVADPITRLERNKCKMRREYEIGINIMKNTMRNFTNNEIAKDQRNLHNKIKQKSLTNSNIMYYEIINDQEVYVITSNLAKEMLKELHMEYHHIGVRIAHKIFRESFISKNDLNLCKQ